MWFLALGSYVTVRVKRQHHIRSNKTSSSRTAPSLHLHHPERQTISFSFAILPRRLTKLPTFQTTHIQSLRPKSASGYLQNASHIFNETVAGSNRKHLIPPSAIPQVLSHAIPQLLTILSRPPSSRTLLHHHPAQSPEDSSEKAASVSTSFYDVNNAENSKSFIYRIVGFGRECEGQMGRRHTRTPQLICRMIWESSVTLTCLVYTTGSAVAHVLPSVNAMHGLLRCFLIPIVSYANVYGC